VDSDGEPTFDFCVGARAAGSDTIYGNSGGETIFESAANQGPHAISASGGLHHGSAGLFSGNNQGVDAVFGENRQGPIDGGANGCATEAGQTGARVLGRTAAFLHGDARDTGSGDTIYSVVRSTINSGPGNED
jgi:hypothetical protein